MPYVTQTWTPYNTGNFDNRGENALSHLPRSEPLGEKERVFEGNRVDFSLGFDRMSGLEEAVKTGWYLLSPGERDRVDREKGIGPTNSELIATAKKCQKAAVDLPRGTFKDDDKYLGAAYATLDARAHLVKDGKVQPVYLAILKIQLEKIDHTHRGILGRMSTEATKEIAKRDGISVKDARQKIADA